MKTPIARSEFQNHSIRYVLRTRDVARRGRWASVDQTAFKTSRKSEKQGELGAPYLQHLVQNGAQCCTFIERGARKGSLGLKLRFLGRHVVARRVWEEPVAWVGER
jgi:hypothetical protein